MRISRQNVLSARVVKSVLALAVASPLAAHAAVLKTAGLYDLSTTVGTPTGTTIAHVANYNSVTNTYTLTNNSVSNGTVNNNGIFGAALVNSSGAIAGSAYRYTSDTITSGSSGSNTWYYDPTSGNTFVIGLTGAAYTGTTLVQNNQNKFINDAGYVVGQAGFYSGTNGTGLFSAWIYSAPTTLNPMGVTTQIELSPSYAAPGASFVTAYTANNGTGPSESYGVSGMNTAGIVFGSCTQYNASNGTNMGLAAWVSGSNGVASRIGMTSANYTAANGTQISSPSYMNNNGVVAGYSTDYASAANGSYNDGFIYLPSTGNSTLIGLSGLPTTDPNYSAAYTTSSVSGLTIVNAYGTTSTTNYTGQAAWSYSLATGTTTKIGLVGTTPVNTTASGYTGNSNATYEGAGNTTYPNPAVFQYATAAASNASGEVIGTQRIYLVGGSATGTASAGTDAYLYNGTSSQVIGPTDAAHTATAGSTVRTMFVSAISPNGYVDGTAYIYNGNPNASANTNQGTDAWVYSPVTNQTTIIGLSTSIATPINNATYIGTTSSTSITKMNNNGQIVGTTTRYIPGTNTSKGADGYFYTPGGTSVQIGLTGGIYLSSDTITESTSISFLNNNVSDAMAAGTSTKYTGATANGNDAWLYDSATNTTYAISSALYPTILNPTVQFLSDTGLLLGSYTSGSTTEAYAYTIAGGLVDLGNAATLLADGGGWSQLATTYTADPFGDIIGRGVLSNDTAVYNSSSNSAVFILATPEPASLGLMGVGAMALLARRRARKN